jgi:hypothetical protein
MRLLGVPAGRPGAGGMQKIHMSDIQNVETIIHLHYLRTTIGGDYQDLVRYTPSMKYAETTAVQTGYQRSDAPLVTGGRMSPIGPLLNFQERGVPERISDNDKLLGRYGFDRNTVMFMAFDIDFQVSPIP